LEKIGGFLPSRCNDKGAFTEPLPSNDRGDTQTHTQTATWSHKPTLFLQNKESRLKKESDHIPPPKRNIFFCISYIHIFIMLVRHMKYHPLYTPSW
jgi:hypothetical protein